MNKLRFVVLSEYSLFCYDLELWFETLFSICMPSSGVFRIQSDNGKCIKNFLMRMLMASSMFSTCFVTLLIFLLLFPLLYVLLFLLFLLSSFIT